MEKRYYWLKLKTDFFDSDDIKLVEQQENGSAYICFYLKLLLRAIKAENPGTLRYKSHIPYTAEILSKVTNTNIDIVRSAIKLFGELGMLEILEDKTIWIEEAKELVGSESSSAERKRRQRAREKAIDDSKKRLEIEQRDNVTKKSHRVRDRVREREKAVRTAPSQKSTKGTTKETPPIHRLTKIYSDLYQEATGELPLVQGKEFGIFNNLLKKKSEEEIKEKLQRFFTAIKEGEWFGDSPSLQNFSGHYNDLVLPIEEKLPEMKVCPECEKKYQSFSCPSCGYEEKAVTA